MAINSQIAGITLRALIIGLFVCASVDCAHPTDVEMEEFLESTTEPYYDGWFKYGRPMVGHTMSGYQNPWPGKLLKEMAEHITANAPEGVDSSVWKYK